WRCADVVREEEAGAPESDSRDRVAAPASEQVLEQGAVVRERIALFEETSLDQVPLREPLPQVQVRRVRDRDPAHVDRAIPEQAVGVAEMIRVVALEADQARALVLEVVGLAPEADGGVSAARAALVRLDVEVIDERCRWGERGGAQRERCERNPHRAAS